MTQTPLAGATLTDAAVLGLLADRPAARARLADLVDAGVPSVVLGVDRGDEGRIDPAVAAQALAALEPRLGVVVAADPTRDHPYNLARRLLSLDHLTAGRAGLALLARRPTGARASTTSWSAGIDDADTPEFARLVATLWSTFPRDALVGDQASGLFAHSERIVRTDHHGRWSVDGPLNSPSSVQGLPPILWFGDADDPESAERARDAGADLVALETDLAGLPGSLAAGHTGVVVRLPTGTLPEAVERIAALGLAGPSGTGSTLRDLLGLPGRPVDTSGLEPAFAAPTEGHW
ncbi:LLM class flavin-dependent oxidoreductase [Frondihabitans cladoniiphilus]|uniref:Luciferase-like domain-containing protein n=1 Tax=Frondihabitans cladoniiphilus TaxID=715785 RepID=A0ABP8VVK4_9MICO